MCDSAPGCELEAVAFVDADVEPKAGLSADQLAPQRVGFCVTHAAAAGLTQPLNKGRLVVGRKGKALGRDGHALAGSHSLVLG
jgi:hypothetical protein